MANNPYSLLECFELLAKATPAELLAGRALLEQPDAEWPVSPLQPGLARLLADPTSTRPPAALP